MARSAPFFVGGVTPLSKLSHSDRPEYVYNYYVTYMDEANIWHYALPPLACFILPSVRHEIVPSPWMESAN